MAQNYSKTPDAATGKPAKLGTVDFLGQDVGMFETQGDTIKDFLEEMCDMCINAVKNGKIPYAYMPLCKMGIKIGVGLSLHCINNDTNAALTLYTDLDVDLSDIKAIYGEVIRSYLLKKGVLRNKGFAKRVAKCEMPVEYAGRTTTGFYKESIEAGLVA